MSCVHKDELIQIINAICDKYCNELKEYDHCKREIKLTLLHAIRMYTTNLIIHLSDNPKFNSNEEKIELFKLYIIEILTLLDLHKDHYNERDMFNTVHRELCTNFIFKISDLLTKLK